MPISNERLPSARGTRAAQRSPRDIQYLRRTLRATLAALDLAFESDLAVVKSSAMDEGLKRPVIAKLQQRHRERRTPYVRHLAALEERFEAVAA
jgi:hypothetical protein